MIAVIPVQARDVFLMIGMMGGLERGFGEILVLGVCKI